MFKDHWIWQIIVMGTLGWYIIVTFIVAFKGYRNIQAMLEMLRGEADGNGLDEDSNND